MVSAVTLLISILSQRLKMKILPLCAIVILFITFIHANVVCNKKCNILEMPTNNCTQCICKANYINLHGLGCDACKKCSKPMVILHKCCAIKQTDTICGPCPVGTYYYHKTGSCKNCSVCDDGFVKTPCGIEHDGECLPRSTMVNKTNATQSGGAFYEIKLYKEKASIYLHLLVTAIVMNVILTVVIFIIWKMWNNQRRFKRALSSSLTANSFTSLVHKRRTLNDLTHEERGMLIREFPGDLHQSLAKLLNPHGSNNWATLAGIWGYTPNKIANFKTSIHAEFTQELLNHWGSSTGATVGALGRALHGIKREDAFTVLYDAVVKFREASDETISEISECTIEEVGEDQ